MPSACADEACRVAFIDHHERIVLFREVANLVNLCYVAVHLEHPVGHDIFKR